ncbi:MFS transporter [Kineococcus sp. SYSU DK002]|uniref:MFS transporter n=1 Tax=Kineococcus sp. SYSU DK002 TaxID=3383123 RepID=UPI003D7D1D82
MPARSTRTRPWRLPLPVRLLLLSQLAFNVGFYLVVPFLAVHLGAGLGLAGWVVGLVLGLRTFSQQGLFFVGGALTDRFGVRPVLLVGCLVRVAGFCALGLTASLPGVLAGTLLTGFAAALFSPAVETGLAHEGRRLEEAGTVTRAELFALDAVVGKVGSLVGPALGAVLLTVEFSTTCLVAAGIFVLVFALNARWAPRERGVAREASITAGWGAVLRNRRFLVFTAFYSTLLLAYNQLYLALPVELERATGSAGALGLLFVLGAVVTVLTQVPLARWARRRGAATALPLGFTGTGLAFAVVAFATAVPAPGWVPALTPAVLFVVLLHLSSAVAGPVARDLVPPLAAERNVGAHYGALASGGGLAVLAGSAALGGALEPGAVLPWALLAVLPLVSAAGLAVLTRRVPPAGRTAGDPAGASGRSSGAASPRATGPRSAGAPRS